MSVTDGDVCATSLQRAKRPLWDQEASWRHHTFWSVGRLRRPFRDVWGGPTLRGSRLGDRVKPLVCCVVREATAIILSILHPKFTAAWPLRLSGREPKGRGVPEHGAYQCVDDPGNQLCKAADRFFQRRALCQLSGARAMFVGDGALNV